MSGKTEIIDSIAPVAGLARAACEGLLDLALAEIAARLKAGETVQIRGFGTFKPAAVAGRTYPNPSGGAPVVKPAGRKVKFKAGFEV